MVQLDWNVESDIIKQKRHDEDPQAKRQRRRDLRRLIILMMVFAALVAIAVLLVRQRLDLVEQRLEDLLVETVGAEVAALRVGDYQAFADLQRSATGDWLNVQTLNFQDYQNYKATSDIELSGTVTDVSLSGQRGRVQVEEVIDGVPYTQTWFYWRYEDGWRHVPPDYTFWGMAQAIEGEQWTINYRDLDGLTASGVQTHLSDWLTTSCQVVACSDLPSLVIDIVSEPLPAITWDETDNTTWRMIVPSPYIGRARADLPFDTNMRVQAAILLAEQMIDFALGDSVPDETTDAAYLRDTSITWLYGQLVDVDTGSQLLESLADNYGVGAVQQLLANLPSDNTLRSLASVTPEGDLASANLDWSDFVLWRLQLESELIQARDEAAWLRLYDPAAVNQVATRFTTPDAMDPALTELTLLSLERGVGPNGTPQLITEVQVQNGTTISGRVVIFNMIDNNWLRAN